MQGPYHASLRLLEGLEQANYKHGKVNSVPGT